ncbi:MAG: ribonuclease R family protein [Planctomycetota bacterium]
MNAEPTSVPTATLLSERLLAELQSPNYEPRRSAELTELLGLPPSEVDRVITELRGLERQGLACNVDGRGWLSPQREGWIVGRLSITRRGFGFVTPAVADRWGDIFIPERKIKDAHHGDLVLVKAGKPKAADTREKRGRESRGGAQRRSGRSRRRRNSPEAAPAKAPASQRPRREGRVIHTLQRSGRVVEGIFRATPGFGGVVEPARPELGRDISVAAGRDLATPDGARVLARVIDGPAVAGLPPGEVIRVRAAEGSWQADLELIVAEYDLSEEFSAAAEREAAAFDAEIDPGERAARVDRRRELIFTIDPQDAKDFDDAVTLEVQPDGGFRLGVFIADVSYYVREGSALDAESRARATSVYLPGRTIPMLPERLSNDLCSLRPLEERLAKGVWMTVSARGELVGWSVERSVIRSSRRYTYGEVQAILDGEPAAPGEEPIVAMIHRMERLRVLLAETRQARGALDLDIPQPRLLLDDAGEIREVAEVPRDRAHNLIEEFMLLANESVARTATERSIAIVRRIHPEPSEEDLEIFLKFCRELVPQSRARRPEDLPRVVAAVKGTPVAQVLHLALLRTLARAEYAADPGLHYALALDEYCHFTSPIRRYADLQVHRALDQALFGVAGGRGSGPGESLEALARHCSDRARAAEEAERELTRLRSIHWLRDFVGETFPGVVISVADFGFFVRLDGNLVEGRVPLLELEDDFYELSAERFELCGARTGRRIRLGDPVWVEVLRADPVRREVDFGYRGKKPIATGPGEA